MSADAAAQNAVVRKLAKRPLFSRLFASGRQPLKLVAVPRDHVQGDRQRGEALLAGRFQLGSETVSLNELDFASLGAGSPVADSLQGFSWLRDLAAAASREKGARLAEALAGRWLLAHGARVDQAWRPDLWGVRILYWTAYAPYILSSRDSGYRSALLNTLVRGARHLDANADKALPGLDRITAWAGLVTAGLLVQGGVPRVARGESGLARALSTAQFEDGGLISRTPYEQALLVDRLALLRGAYFAAKQSLPDAIEAAAAAALAALHGVTMGDGALSSWQGGNPGRGRPPARLGRRLRPARPAASPGTRLGLSPHVGARHRAGHRRSAAAPAENGLGRLRIDPGLRNVGRLATAGHQLRRACAAPDGPAAGPGRGPSHHGRRTARSSSPTPTRRRSCPTARSARAWRTSPSSAARTMTAAGWKRATTATSAASAWCTSAA